MVVGTRPPCAHGQAAWIATVATVAIYGTGVHTVLPHARKNNQPHTPTDTRRLALATALSFVVQGWRRGASYTTRRVTMISIRQRRAAVTTFFALGMGAQRVRDSAGAERKLSGGCLCRSDSSVLFTTSTRATGSGDTHKHTRRPP
jgi:hypothetical protein